MTAPTAAPAAARLRVNPAEGAPVEVSGPPAARLFAGANANVTGLPAAIELWDADLGAWTLFDLVYPQDPA